MVPPAPLIRLFVAPTPALPHDFRFQYIPAMSPKGESVGEIARVNGNLPYVPT